MAEDAEFSTAFHFSRLRRFVLALFVILGLLLAGIYVGVIGATWGEPLDQWLPELVISSLILLAGALVSLWLVSFQERKVHLSVELALEGEVKKLQAAQNELRALQLLSSGLAAPMGVKRAMEAALDVCFLVLEEMGAPARTSIGVVFLREGDELLPVVIQAPDLQTAAGAPGSTTRDHEKLLVGGEGFVSETMQKAEITISSEPGQDPELLAFAAFQECHTAMGLPLQSYGALVLGAKNTLAFQDQELALFRLIASQAVVSLQHARLYESLAAERQKALASGDAVRRELANTLRDGLGREVSALAGRIELLRSMVRTDPYKAVPELNKVEALARQASQELGSILFQLRPTILEDESLSEAVAAIVVKMRDSNGLNIRLVGREHGELLDREARSLVCFFVEEALYNAHKYASARTIEVSLGRKDNWFAIRVKDDGLGFHGQAGTYASSGPGLAYVRLRVERAGGSLRIKSAPGKGTTAILAVPLNRPDPKEAV